MLETLANINYNTPRPRPIDPTVFFELVKIRRLVDEATELAVRAATDSTASTADILPASLHQYFGRSGFSSGNQPKLSRERKYRMRDQATQKLSKAYHLDEIACSVATMQSTSALEDVASLVLQRKADHTDAKYVHFFHEKIPSRQLAESTNLAPLDEIIRDKAAEGQPLRTRAIVRGFKEDYEGAVADLTLALQMFRHHKAAHDAMNPTQQGQGPVYQVAQHRGGRRQEDIVLKEDEQPSSLEIQLLFQRASVYLNLACTKVHAALPEPVPTPQAASSSPAPIAAQQAAFEAQKAVKQNAKRALRDYMAFLAHFEYTPDLPIDIADDFSRRVNQATHFRTGRSQFHMARAASPSSGDAAAPSHRTYSMSELFNASPPAGLPPYPVLDVVPARSQPAAAATAAAAAAAAGTPVQTTTESLTYHPLLADALHAVLLCHCLVQTSSKELQRHAYMVARLARLADGYPLFQASRSPARSDWLEVLRKGENWIQLVGTWESLSAPAPLPLFQSFGGNEPMPKSPNQGLLAKQAMSLQDPNEKKPAQGVTAGAQREQKHDVVAEGKEGHLCRDPQSIAIQSGRSRASQDHSHGEESELSQALRARQARAERDYRLDNAVAALDAKLTRAHVGLEVGTGSGTTTPLATDSNLTDVEDGRTGVVDTVANGKAGVLFAASVRSSNPVEGPSNVDHEKAVEVKGEDGAKDLAETAAGTATNGLGKLMQSKLDAGVAVRTKPAIPPPSKPTAKAGATHGDANTGPRGRAAFEEYPVVTERANAVARWVREAPPHAGLVAPDGTRRRKKKPTKKAAALDRPAYKGPLSLAVNDGRIGGSAD